MSSSPRLRKKTRSSSSHNPSPSPKLVESQHFDSIPSETDPNSTVLQLFDISVKQDVDQAQFDAIDQIIHDNRGKHDILKRCAQLLLRKIQTPEHLSAEHLNSAKVVSNLFYSTIRPGSDTVELIETPAEIIDFFVSVYNTDGGHLKVTGEYLQHLSEFFVNMFMVLPKENIPRLAAAAFERILVKLDRQTTDMLRNTNDFIAFFSKIAELMEYILGGVNLSDYQALNLYEDENLHRINSLFNRPAGYFALRRKFHTHLILLPWIHYVRNLHLAYIFTRAFKTDKIPDNDVPQIFRKLHMIIRRLLKQALWKISHEGSQSFFTNMQTDETNFMKNNYNQFIEGNSLKKWILVMEEHVFKNNPLFRMDVFESDLKTEGDLKDCQRRIRSTQSKLEATQQQLNDSQRRVQQYQQTADNLKAQNDDLMNQLQDIKNSSEKDRCIYCMRPCQKAAFPCGHMLVCSEHNFDTNIHTLCSKCNQPIERIIRIFGC
eukprot:764875-Hanusia_phi.AAC.4